MSATTAAQVKLVIPPEVWIFSRERQIDQYLDRVVALLHRIFADARRLSVEIHDDPEIADLRSLLFDVEVPWPSFAQAQEAYRAWHDGLFATIPLQHLCDIALIIHRVDE